MADNMMEWNIRDTKEQFRPGSIVMDDWELKELLGQGGFGDVWRAEKNLLGIKDQSAIKIIRIPRDSTEISAMHAEGFSRSSIQAELRLNVEKAVREIRAMFDLRNHPAIVPCEGFDVIQYEEDGSWEIDIRMQLLKPLPDWAKTTDVKPEDVIRMGISLSNLLSVCETKGILHRDIKPSNIFVDQIGNFKLGDFGLARIISGSGSTHSKGVGTEAFMAPEVFAGKKYDHRADIYSLGLVMYWLLNCQSLPFTNVSTSRNQAITRRLSGEPIPALPGIDPELDRIVRKACETAPEKRWKTAKEFHDALVNSQIRANSPQPTKSKKDNQDIKKRKIILPILTVIALLACGYLVYRTIDPGNKGYTTIETSALLDQANKAKDDALALLGEANKKLEDVTAERNELAANMDRLTKSRDEALAQVDELTVARDKALAQLKELKATAEETFRKSIVVGNYVPFGTYPQTASGDDNTPIEWLVLARGGGTALLISRYGLDVQPYNEESAEVTWEKCTLRAWLNSTFLNRAFSSAEQARILLTNVDNSSSQGYSGWSTVGGSNSLDRIFLLSYAEVNHLFTDTADADRRTKLIVAPTAYALNAGAFTSDKHYTIDGVPSGSWWLRSPGYSQDWAARISEDGSLNNWFVSSEVNVVRPALWINLESESF